ncbi:MAG: MarR family transcriptional regulator [Bacillota bacterium]
MNEVESCLAKVEEVMRLFSARLKKTVVEGAGHGEESTGQGRHEELPLFAAVGGGPYYFLRILGEKGRSTVSEVAAELGVTLAAVTVLANKLVSSNWIERRRDERDRRVVRMELTREGGEVLAQAQTARKDMFLRYFTGLTAEDIKALDRIMEAVLTKLQEEEFTMRSGAAPSEE